MSILLAASAVTNALALYTKGASNAVFNIGEAEKHTVTYYLPTHSSASDTNFTSYSVQVSDGTNLYTALSSYAVAKGSYSFSAWHSSKDHFASYDENKDPISNTTTVTGDMTVYAKYVQSNVGYYNAGSDVYLTSTTNNRTIDASKFYYGTRIYSVNGVDGAEVDLRSASGVYDLVKNGNNWSVLRQVTINVSNVTWWTDYGAKQGVYCATNDDSSSEWVTPSFSSNKTTLHVDVSYNKFVIVRYSSSATQTSGYNDVWNQTVDIKLDEYGKGSNIYGSANSSGGVKCYEIWIEDEKVGGTGADKDKNKYSWWHS